MPGLWRWQIPGVGITLQQYEQMNKRLGGKTSRRADAVQTPSLAVRAPQVVLGVDPSLRGTGLQTVRGVLAEFKPEVCVVEGLFFAQNIKTAIIMGEARGAALAAMGEAGLDIYEIAPRKVKQAVVGYGAAQKLAVAKMVQRMLQLADLPAPDAADALALALAHAKEQSRFSLNTPRKI